MQGLVGALLGQMYRLELLRELLRALHVSSTLNERHCHHPDNLYLVYLLSSVVFSGISHLVRQKMSLLVMNT